MPCRPTPSICKPFVKVGSKCRRKQVVKLELPFDFNDENWAPFVFRFPSNKCLVGFTVYKHSSYQQTTETPSQDQCRAVLNNFREPPVPVLLGDVRESSQFLHFSKIGGLWEPSRVSDFFQGKIYGSQAWWFSAIWEQSVFWASFHKPDHKNFNVCFWKLNFKLFFGQKYRLWIYFQQFMNPQFHLFKKLFQIVTLFLGLHLSQ